MLCVPIRDLSVQHPVKIPINSRYTGFLTTRTPLHFTSGTLRT